MERYPLIYIGSPVRNAHGEDETKAWILPEYLDGILRLDYPKDRITLSFLVNDCVDNSLDLLLNLRNAYKDQYRKIIVNSVDFKVLNYIRTGGARVGYDHLAMIRNLWLDSLSDEDYIFSVDTDIVMLPNTLSTLLSHNLDMCAALISNLFGNFSICNILNLHTVQKKTHNPSEPVRDFVVAAHVQDIPQSEVIEIDVTGAVALMHRKIIDAGVRFSDDKQGEDIAFCTAVKEAGFKIHCDTGHRLFHVMGVGLLEDLELWKKENNLI